MTTQKYLMTSKTGVQIEFGYDGNGRLVEFRLASELEEEHHKWLIDRLPFTKTDLEKLGNVPSVTITEIPLDLSFETFWKAFDYKVGSKPKAETLWNKLTDADKTLALQAIPKYKFYLKESGLACIYPERFISQERFKNEFK